MMNKWNGKNALWMLLYTALYAVVTALVCVTGSIHPIFFVCYQITAGILLSGIIIRAFGRIQAPGVAACLALGVILLLLAIGDAVAWHVIPLVMIAVLAEVIRAISRDHWAGEVAAAVIMSFSTFGYYGQIWFHRAYTYECALEEMPAGYGDALMALSPVWVLPVVLIIGVAVSVLIAEVTAKLFQIEQGRGVF